MRLREIYLFETSDEDRAIISLSSSLYDYLQKYSPDGESVKVGKIGDLFNTPLQAMNNISIELVPQGDLLNQIQGNDVDPLNVRGNPIGCWFPKEQTIKLNKDKINAKGLQSIISHELRHVLDDFKSDNKASQSNRYNTPKNKNLRSGSGDPYTDHAAYLAQPNEINARFIQVLNGLAIAIKVAYRKYPAEQAHSFVMKKFKDYMNRYHIDELFPEGTQSKDYQRLIKRAMSFIQKETAHIKSASF